MILAAQTGRKYWEIAGTWLQVERAEYRVASTYLKADDPSSAVVHAQRCLKISQDNNAPALELFFAYEAITQVEKARNHSVGVEIAVRHAKTYFAQLSDYDKEWCKESLGRLENFV